MVNLKYYPLCRVNNDLKHKKMKIFIAEIIIKTKSYRISSHIQSSSKMRSFFTKWKKVTIMSKSTYTAGFATISVIPHYTLHANREKHYKTKKSELI